MLLGVYIGGLTVLLLNFVFSRYSDYSRGSEGMFFDLDIGGCHGWYPGIEGVIFFAGIALWPITLSIRLIIFVIIPRLSRRRQVA